MKSKLFVAAVLVLACACSWTRFDDVQQDAPVLLLTKPDGVGQGFGASLAFAGVDGNYRVLAASSPGAHGAAEYEIGGGQGTNHDAVRTGYCGDGCTLGRSVAALKNAWLDGKPWPWCFAVGFGVGPPANPAPSPGIVVQCEAAPPNVSVLAVPSGVTLGGPELALGSEDAEQQPLLVAGLVGQNGDRGRAWSYDTKQDAAGPLPLELDPGATFAIGPSYGRAVVVLHAGGERRIAVGEPDQARVFVFDQSGALQRCLSGPEHFGLALAAGQVSGSGDDELVVADGQSNGNASVHVLDGAALTGGASGCGPGSEIVALSCKSTADASGCGGGEYGAALAVADLDHDGDGEVLVGAPGMSSREESAGGAVLIYDVEPAHPDWLSEAKIISSAESGDRLGSSLAIVRQPDRDIFVAGAPGNGKAAVFFCSKLLPSGLHGSRCE
jgi:hypothetical protein